MSTFSFKNSTKITSDFFPFITSISVSKLLYHLKRRVQETSTFIAKDVHVNSVKCFSSQ